MRVAPVVLVLVGWVAGACVDDDRSWLRLSNLTCQQVASYGMCDSWFTSSLPFSPTILRYSDFCPLSCGRCPTCRDDPLGVLWMQRKTCQQLQAAGNCSADVGGVLGMVLCPATCMNCPSGVAVHPATMCDDDPFRQLVATTCESLVNEKTCGGIVDVGGQNMSVSFICPSSCWSCFSIDTSYSFTQCIDDPQGNLAKWNYSCPELLSYYSCQAPLPGVDGYRVSSQCPRSCGTCPAKTGDAARCRPFRLNKYYQYPSGSSLDNVLGSIPEIRGGWHGDANACYEMGLVAPLQSHFCVLWDGKVSLCLPKACTSNDARDFYRELTGGTFMGDVQVNCEDELPRLSDDTSACVVLALVLLFLLLVVIGTRWRSQPPPPLLRHSTMASCGSPMGASKLVPSTPSSPHTNPRQAPSSCVPATLRCWDARANLRALLAPRVERSMAFMDSIRVLSVAWVVLGHTFLFVVSTAGYGNPSYQQDRITGPTGIPLAAAEYAVDSFFWMSGFLGCAALLKVSWEKPHLFVAPAKLVGTVAFGWLQRWLRLVPMMMFTILVGHELVPYMGSGPYWYRIRWNLVGYEEDTCSRYWWTNLLLVNNFHPSWPGDACYGWLWYLACDFQFSVLLPFIVLPGVVLELQGKEPKVVLLARSLPLLLIALSVALAGKDSIDRTNHTYVMPYLRMSPYLWGVVGALTRAMIKKRSEESHPTTPTREGDSSPFASTDIASPFSRLQDGSKGGYDGWRVRWGSYAVGFGLWSTLIMLLWWKESRHEDGNDWPRSSQRAFAALYAFGWGLSLNLIFLPFTFGHGGVVGEVMSLRGWEPLGKLVYGVYLLHPFVLYTYGGSSGGVRRYTDYSIAWDFAAATAVSFFFSAAAWVLVERPFAVMVRNLERVLQFRRRKACVPRFTNPLQSQGTRPRGDSSKWTEQPKGTPLKEHLVEMDEVTVGDVGNACAAE